jgi:hypothetical protein
MGDNTEGYPATYELQAPEALDRWRPLVQWVLAIPHLVIANVLGNVAAVVALVSGFTILFTTRIPTGLYEFQVMIIRYRARTYAYAGFLHDRYPRFEFAMSAIDPGGDPVRVDIPAPQGWNRWLPLVKWLLAVPHYVVLFVLWAAALACWVAGLVTVVVTGRWPDGLREFLVGVNRYTTRVSAYIFLLRDEYPPLALKR